jgi:PST family polysaccharide transporter
MLIGRFCGSQLLGMYDRAYHLSNMLPNQVLGSLNNLAVAAFSRLDNPDKYRHSFLAMLSILAFVGMPLSAALVLNSEDLILLLLGPQWIKAGEIFFAFGLSIGVAIIYLTHGWLHLSLGTPERWFRWGIIEFIVSVSCFLVGLLYGALGVAIAYSSSFYILIIPGLCYAGRPIDLRFSFIMSAVWKYYVSAAGAGFLSWLILYKYEFTSGIFSRLNIFIRISVSSAICILIYLALVIVFWQGVRPILEFISVLREMIPKNFSSK